MYQPTHGHTSVTHRSLPYFWHMLITCRTHDVQLYLFTHYVQLTSFKQLSQLATQASFKCLHSFSCVWSPTFVVLMLGGCVATRNLCTHKHPHPTLQFTLEPSPLELTSDSDCCVFCMLMHCRLPLLLSGKLSFGSLVTVLGSSRPAFAVGHCVLCLHYGRLTLYSVVFCCAYGMLVVTIHAVAALPSAGVY